MHAVMCIDAAYCYRRSVVCVSVCLLVTTLSCVKTAEPTEMPFGACGLGWAQERCIKWGTGPLQEKGHFGGGENLPL